MRVLILFVGFLVSGASFSANVLHTSTVKNVYQLADGRFVLQFDTDSPSCTSTGSPQFYYLGVGFNSMTAEAARNAYAMALTAFAMGKRLQIRFDDASSGCYINSILMLGN